MTSRVVYMGTPEFACPTLEMLARSPDVEVTLVVTQPDRKAGRGRRLQSPPVKQLADRLGLPVHQAPSLRSPEQRQPIVDANPDLVVVAAFGLILGKSILELPRRGCVNLHASLLPRYRGASPVAAAILNGDRETGVTLMRMDRGLDTGPMIANSAMDITPEDTTGSLTTRLATLAAQLLMDSLNDVVLGQVTSVPQPEGASITRPLVKADGWIDWSQPAAKIERHVRAMWPWPRAWTTLPDGGSFQIHEAHVERGLDEGVSGEVRIGRDGPRIRCGVDWLHLGQGQLAGGNPASGAHLAMRTEFSTGDILGEQDPPDSPGHLIVSL